MTTLAEYLRDEMAVRGETEVWSGDPDLCISAYIRSGGKVRHPLNKIKAVIDAARKSSLFEPADFIRAHDSSGRRQILMPVFKLRPNAVMSGAGKI